jgi:small-conductance mechanosensitive channel
MTTEAAWFWTWRITVFVGYVVAANVLFDLAERIGMVPDVLFAARRIVGFGGFLLLLEAIWRMPAGDGDRVRRFGRAWALTAFVLAFYLLRASGQDALGWSLFVVVALPFAIGQVHRAVAHILRPPGTEADPDPRPSLTVAVVEGTLRLALVIGAAMLLAGVWGLDVQEMAASESMTTRLVRGAINGAVILLVADFLWRVVRTLIDRSLRDAIQAESSGGEEAKRRARLLTLLPIMRNLVFAVLAAMAILMALSAIGIEIAPLIAGAGVVGIAIGFGAQTLVKDVISGLFFLLDDAFRVGEYIQSGSYKGTVEAFSLRSVKLRHHRGPLYTVPFGELSAVQNMSRDWVIDKLTIGVPYDTDLEKARKLVKAVGKTLAADPEMGRHILETLKMQGVEAFGDFAIQIRLKIMTRPGEQFVIRRKAMALVRQAFQENGIEFALPKVQVASDAPAAAAAAAVASRPVEPAPGAA